MKQYLQSLQHVLHHGVYRSDRTGTGTLSVFGTQERYDLNEGFPAVTTRKLAFKTMVSELLWFISGSGDERRLCEILHGTRDESKKTIWTANAQADYWTSSAKYDGDLGVVYGNMWTKWPGNPNRNIKINRRPAESDKLPTQIDPKHELVFCVGIRDIVSCHHAIYGLWMDLMRECYGPLRNNTNTTVSGAWKTYSVFENDIKEIAGFYDWIDNTDGYTLNPHYYGANQYSKSTALFMKDEYASELSNNDAGDLLIRRELYINQLEQLIDGIKRDPYGRRHILSAWNPTCIPNMALPPCHTMAQFYVANGKLSCQLYQRSSDLFLGKCINISSYALLTHMIAQVCDLQVGEYIHTNGDAHIYTNHMDQVKEQLSREPYPLPKLWLNPDVRDITKFTMDDFKLLNYEHHPALTAPMAV